jgi:hypothetical protein
MSLLMGGWVTAGAAVPLPGSAHDSRPAINRVTAAATSKAGSRRSAIASKRDMGRSMLPQQLVVAAIPARLCPRRR